MVANTNSLDLEYSSAQYAFITDNVPLSITGDISIEAWVKLERLPSTIGDRVAIVAKWRLSGQQSYLFRFTADDKLEFWADETGANTDLTRNTATSATVSAGDVGAWVHLAVTCDISVPAVKMYKNGVEIATTVVNATATSIFDSTSNFQIGAYQNAAGTADDLFDGLVDDVRVWSDVRTDNEIADNMSRELVGDEANLVGYWKLNNDYLDETSNNSDLTGGGTPVFSTDVPFSLAPGGFIFTSS